MSHFRYIGQKLFVERLSLSNIIKKNKTPFYLYSESQLKENYSNKIYFTDKLEDTEVHVAYFDKFNQADKDKWIKRSEEVGHPEQVIFRLGWNRRKQERYKWEDFDY